MRLSRRHLLALIGAAGAVAAAGAASVGLRWWDQAPDAPFGALEDEEAAVVRAVGAAAFPGGASIALHGRDADLDRFFDVLLLALPATQRKLLKLNIDAGGVQARRIIDRLIAQEPPQAQLQPQLQIQPLVQQPQAA